MPVFEHTHHRRSIRLKEYDYSEPGSYFITIPTRDRQRLLATIDENGVHLSVVGLMVTRVWESLPERFSTVLLGAFVVIPGHIHGIITILESRKGEACLRPGQNPATQPVNKPSAVGTQTSVGLMPNGHTDGRDEVLGEGKLRPYSLE